MKNILTLKKFCLVVAIVGLLHTIVDAETIAIPNVKCWRHSSETATLYYESDYNYHWDLETLLVAVRDNWDTFGGKLLSQEVIPYAALFAASFVNTYSDIVVEVYNKHGYVAIAHNSIIDRYYRLDNGQLYQLTIQYK